MAKPEWGMKRICASCGARFYDLRRSPIVCPKCGTTYDPDQLTRLKRSRGAAEEAPKKVAAVVEEEALETGGNDDIEDVVEEEDDTVLEDANDLGEDEDELDELVDGVDKEKED